jgi:ASC-1-like (ASCH) protein
MRVVHLVLKYKWFDLIASGHKKIEHRNVTERWWKMLVENIPDAIVFHRGYTSTTILKNVTHVDLGPDTDPGPNFGTGEYIRIHLS